MSAAKKKGMSASGVAWTVVSIIAIVAIGAVVGIFVIGKGGAKPTPTPTVTASQSATPTPTPSAPADVIASQIVSLVAARDGAGLVGYMADTIKYVRFGSDAPVGNLTPAQLATQLTSDFGTENWEPTDNATIDQWRSSDWAKYFPAGAVIMSSDADHFISIVLDSNNHISAVTFGVGASLG